MMRSDLTVGVFRPDDGRLESAAELIDALGATPVADPMLDVEPTGGLPREDADVAVLTSTTGVDLVSAGSWTPGDATVAAIGPTTAGALREAGYDVDVVPDTYTSSGLVTALEEAVDGKRVEVARSDHGSPVLTEGLEEAGAYVHETVLYELVRPVGSGVSTERAAEGSLDVALFTSSLTVEHFLEAAAEREISEAALEGLESALVGAIGPPTAETAREHGIVVDVVPDQATFEALATEAIEEAAPTYFE